LDKNNFCITLKDLVNFFSVFITEVDKRGLVQKSFNRDIIPTQSVQFQIMMQFQTSYVQIQLKREFRTLSKLQPKKVDS